MNQKDYKEIGKIIRKWSEYSPCYSPKSICEDISKDLANYFERESKENINKFSQLDSNCPSPFNREQFLKDCGVNEVV